MYLINALFTGVLIAVMVALNGKLSGGRGIYAFL